LPRQLRIAIYEGNRYGAPNTNTAAGTVAPCGYQPSDLYTAYNLHSLYKEGLNGDGVTIAIVDAYGSTTIANDVKAFSVAMGLPQPNLTIIGTPTETNYSTDANASWAAETTLDVEWVHAIAPGAKIVLVVTPTNSFDDLFAGILKAASAPGVVAISDSWSGYDIGIAGESEFYEPYDNLLKQVGASGISVDFAMGDYGNNAAALDGLYTSTGWPGSSPYATGVGGVSAVLNSHKAIAWQTSWGTNLTEIADKAALGSPPIDPDSEHRTPRPSWPHSAAAGNVRGFKGSSPACKPRWTSRHRKGVSSKFLSAGENFLHHSDIAAKIACACARRPRTPAS
jgi:subtilase family serine protease